jgi:hypothetical protein
MLSTVVILSYNIGGWQHLHRLAQQKLPVTDPRLEKFGYFPGLDHTRQRGGLHVLTVYLNVTAFKLGIGNLAIIPSNPVGIIICIVYDLGNNLIVPTPV